MSVCFMVFELAVVGGGEFFSGMYPPPGGEITINAIAGRSCNIHRDTLKLNVKKSC